MSQIKALYQAVLPSMVALWNLVKNGGDLYSALLNHIKPIHVKLNGKGKVLLQGIHTTFYQIYQTVRIWTTVQVLSNPAYKIESYSDLRAVVTNTMPKFRQLVRDIALEKNLICSNQQRSVTPHC